MVYVTMLQIHSQSLSFNYINGLFYLVESFVLFLVNSIQLFFLKAPEVLVMTCLSQEHKNTLILAAFIIIIPRV